MLYKIMAAIAPGAKLSHFAILDKLGEGGMGIVYKARDERLDRVVAIKVLPEKMVADPERHARFIQEAKAASALNHPNVVTVYEIDAAGATPPSNRPMARLSYMKDNSSALFARAL